MRRMLDLVSIEYRKVVNYGFAQLLFVFYLLLLAVAVIVSNFLQQKTFFDLPNVWLNLTAMAAYSHWFVAMLIITNVGNDFRFKIARQHIIDGISPEQYLLLKLTLVGCVSLLTTSVIFLLGTVGSMAYAKLFSFEGLVDFIHYVPLHFAQAFIYLTLALTIALLVRRTMMGALTFAFYIFAETVTRKLIVKEPGEFYFPLRVIGDLTKVGAKDNPVEPWLIGLLAVFYLVVLVTISWAGLKYRDFR